VFEEDVSLFTSLCQTTMKEADQASRSIPEYVKTLYYHDRGFYWVGTLVPDISTARTKGLLNA
jgi:hypothetical protein